MMAATMTKTKEHAIDKYTVIQLLPCEPGTAFAVYWQEEAISAEEEQPKHFEEPVIMWAIAESQREWFVEGKRTRVDEEKSRSIEAVVAGEYAPVLAVEDSANYKGVRFVSHFPTLEEWTKAR